MSDGSDSNWEDLPGPDKATGTHRPVNVPHASLRERLLALDDDDDKGSLRKEDYPARWKEVVGLWRSLFMEHRDFYPVAEEFEPHFQMEHCVAIEELLNRIIYGTRSGTTMAYGSFVPTAREALLLVSAVWLHPIGLLWGLKEDEFPVAPAERSDRTESAPPASRIVHRLPKPNNQLEKLAVDYEERTADYLTTTWKRHQEWSQENRELLAKLCKAQRAGFDLTTLDTTLRKDDKGELLDDTETSDRPWWNVNLRKLAALLRLAMACRIQPGYCPLDVVERLKPMERPMADTPKDFYREIVDLVADVDVKHGAHAIVMTAVSPQPVNFEKAPPKPELRMPLILNILSGLEYLRTKLQSIVDEVTPSLKGCANTRLEFVNLNLLSVEMNAADEATAYTASAGNCSLRFQPLAMPTLDFFHKVWALQLAATTCATEVACSFALVVHRTLSDELGRLTSPDSKTINSRLGHKAAVALSVQPFNAMVRRLAADINRKVESWGDQSKPKDHETRELLNLVEEFMKDRQANCDACGELASALLKDLKAIVVYGYSRNVLSGIKAAHRKGFSGVILHVPVSGHFRTAESTTVELRDQPGQHKTISGERSSMDKELAGLGLKVLTVTIESLPSLLRPIRDAHVVQGSDTPFPFAFAVGTRAVLEPQEDRNLPETYIVTQGNEVVASAVKSAGGFVYVICESGKLAVGEETSGLQSDIDQMQAREDLQEYQRFDQLELGKDVDQRLMPRA